MDVEPRLGIDFGGVIVPMVDPARQGDTQFSDRFRSTPPRPGAIEGIRALVGAFAAKVWIVSKAGERTEALTRLWLRDQDFFSLTGLDEGNLRFCRERPEKKPICTELGITHFLDDRMHIMQILLGSVPYLYLFGDVERNHSARRWTTLVGNWTEAREAITRDLPQHP